MPALVLPPLMLRQAPNATLNLRAAWSNEPSITPLNFMFSHNFHKCYKPARQVEALVELSRFAAVFYLLSHSHNIS
jgi:hypothetical protein